jgi:hypothetical protein
LQSVENQGVYAHSKATPKPPKRKPKSIKPLRDKDLLKFFSVFQSSEKTTTPTPPLGTIFAGTTFVFSIHFCLTEKPKNEKRKINQTIERVALACFSVFFSVPFRFLFGFMHTCKKQVITKHRPDLPTTPPLLLS